MSKVPRDLQKKREKIPIGRFLFRAMQFCATVTQKPINTQMQCAWSDVMFHSSGTVGHSIADWCISFLHVAVGVRFSGLSASSHAS